MVRRVMENYIGRTISRLHIERIVVTNKRKYFECLCECGKNTTARCDSVLSGKIQSCGCLRDETTKEVHTKHGDSHERLYIIYKNIKARCYNKNHDSYIRYGAKGIFMCDDWKNSYNVFKEWSESNGYADSLSIDRVDNNKGYAPTNCRWVDMYTQANNTSKNIRIYYDGREDTLPNWCRELDYDYHRLRRLYQKGVTDPIKLFIPENKLNGFKGTK
ncbi:HNH endonuclease [Bacillus phage AvesoBmore]|uniref:Uncharacterized protein n=1 Tax=Bacillus phage AvesoBmore TaxID=1698451 RepID=A0A0K2D131_9CAUD|nr:HNH endonuclease [Bacillus phage AvesoBmore]ALA13465.1 hypothetical protein AVESOBMORE_118 [Bacillus phage AvesoBmore]